MIKKLKNNYYNMHLLQLQLTEHISQHIHVLSNVRLGE